MRKLGKILTLSLAALLLFCGLTASVSAEEILVLGEQKQLTLSGNGAVPILFTASEDGIYGIYCTVTDEFSTAIVMLNEVPLSDGTDPVTAEMKAGATMMVSLSSDGEVTVAVQVQKIGDLPTIVPTVSTDATVLPTGSTETIPTVPTDPSIPTSTTTSTTEPWTTTTSATTTTTTTIPTSTTTLPTLSTGTTAALPGVLFPTGATTTTTTASKMHPLVPSVSGGGSGTTHLSLEIEKAIWCSVLALLIMVVGGVVIYIITKRQTNH